MIIFPKPKELTFLEGTCPVNAQVSYTPDPSLAKEEYRITVSPEGISVAASTGEGTFRAQTTLKQILAQNPDTIPCLTLHDWPDYPVRGLWHNVGSRVPSMETFKRQLDFMADMKINHVEMTVGSYNYAFPSFPQMHLGQDPFTQDELKELSAYAKERYIDLVPCMQTFGHVNDWLACPDFADLAECPDGFEQWGRHMTPGTLNPLDPRSQELARRKLDDVMPCFPDSGLFNIGCDETWELGLGKSKEACEKYGKTRVFLDFVTQTIDYLREHGIKPLFWADIILQGSQEVLNAMPKDSVALNWGYERFEVPEENCARLQQTGVPYWNCPGTAIWGSLLCQSYKAVTNIARCAVLGKRYGASGLLNTDWPDNNLHHFSPSYFGIAYGAAQGWTVAEEDWKPDPGDLERKAIVEPNAAQLAKISPTAASCFDYLNYFVYKDSRNRMAHIDYDAGLYGHISRHDHIHNNTQVKRLLVLPPENTDTLGYDAKDFRDTKDYLDTILFRLTHEPRMACDDAEWIIDEYRDSIAMLKYSCDLGLYLLGELDGMTKESYAAQMRARRDDILREHDRVWKLRNRDFDNGAARYFRQFDNI